MRTKRKSNGHSINSPRKRHSLPKKSNLKFNSRNLKKRKGLSNENLLINLSNNQEKFIKFVLKLLGDETFGEINGFVEEWEYFQDLDLIILGSPGSEYKEYTDLLREEYNNMDIENYNKLRSKENLRFRRRSKTSSPTKRKSKTRLRNGISFTNLSSTRNDEEDCVIIEPLENSVICIDCDVDETTVEHENRILNKNNNDISDCTVISPKYKDTTVVIEDNSFININEHTDTKELLSSQDLFLVDKKPGAHGSKVPLYEVNNSIIPVFDNKINCNTNDECVITGVDDSVIYCGKKRMPIKNGTIIRKRNKHKGNNKIQPFRAFKNISQLESSTGCNFYNPNKCKPSGKKRMVIIDGSNVAYGHSNNRQFSAEGLSIAIKFFEKLGHEVKAVVPQHRMKSSETTNQSVMMDLQTDGKIVLTPSKSLPGKNSSSYDDRFILQFAIEFDSCVISNDNYRDLVYENDDFKKIVETRVIGYTWLKDMFVVPNDPYGKTGPTLQQILNRS